MPQEMFELVVVTNDNPSDKFEIPNWAVGVSKTAQYADENAMLLVMAFSGWKIAHVLKLERKTNLGPRIVTWIYFERAKERSVSGSGTE